MRFGSMRAVRPAASRHQPRPVPDVGRILICVLVLAAFSGCKSVAYHLEVVEQLHDDDYNLTNEIAVMTPIDEAIASAVTLLFDSDGKPEPTVVKNPGMRCQRAILATSYAQPRDDGEYGRTLAVLAPVSALTENALTRAYALDLMVFHYQNNHEARFGAVDSGADVVDPTTTLDELKVYLEAFAEDPDDDEAIRSCKSALIALGDVAYSTWRDGASVLRLFASLYPSGSHAVFRGDIRRGIHRVAPQVLRMALTSALSARETAFVREEAVEGLGLLGNRDAIPQLNRVVIRDRSEDVRRRAAEALGRLRDRTAVPTLIEALELDEDAGVRWHAQMALVEITETDLGTEPAVWRDWWRKTREGKAG